MNKALTDKLPSWAPAQSVVLIDEIDKAPPDFPNDLLRELDKQEFSLPELAGLTISSEARLRPIVVITSNSERALPAPLLRRCIYCNIPFPEDTMLLNLVVRRLRIQQSDHADLKFLLDLFLVVREKGPILKRLPSTAELLDWLHYLKLKTGLARLKLRSNAKDFVLSAACLAKRSEDIKTISLVLESWISQ